MKDKIAKIIWFNKDEVKAAEEILDLSVDGVITIGDLLTMWKNDYLKIEVADKCSGVADKIIKAKGWIHKDDPVKGMKVKTECPDREPEECDDCKQFGTDCNGKIERPLIIGEALKMLPNMVYLLSEKVNDPLYRDALTTKDGGIVGVKE